MNILTRVILMENFNLYFGPKVHSGFGDSHSKTLETDAACRVLPDWSNANDDITTKSIGLGITPRIGKTSS